MNLQAYRDLLVNYERDKHPPRLCFGNFCEIVDYSVSNSDDNISSGIT
jgi:hypothetical protein